MKKPRCSVDNCKSSSRSRGFCNKHYLRVLKYNDPLFSKLNREHSGFCKVSSCDSKYYSNEYCYEHWKFAKNGVNVEKIISDSKNIKECEICKTSVPGGQWNTFYLDHDHGTGNPRGFLCRSCNVGLGHFKDNVEVLNSAINYLKKYGVLSG